MLFSLALIILLALAFSLFFNKLKLPSLIGMLLAGLILGPFFLDLIDESILNVSLELRQIALIVILFRAGLSLDLERLKTIGRPAVLLSFLPATIEVIAITLIAPIFFDISYIDAAIMGTIVAAVSPAVIVPRMILFIEKKKTKQSLAPELVLAGASIDDVYVIVLFTSLIALAQSGRLEVSNFLNLPLKIVLGIIIGGTLGFLLSYFFKKVHIRDTIKVLIIFAFSFLFVYLEEINTFFITFSGLLAILSMGIVIYKTYPVLANRLKQRFEKLWVIAEIVLFVLVGALIDLSVLSKVGLFAVLLILLALAFRVISVFIALIKTKFNPKEKLFTAISYIPKATVQAALGSIPLALGLPNGDIIFAVSVVSIVLTAPLGAILIDQFGFELLKKDEK
jgi:solute carrier family 9B (sodium/hydrogen exchanger), member 1/2